MEIRKFRSAYDLELIPASHEGIIPGDLVWDPVFGAPVFSRQGMPNTIYTAFLDARLISNDERKLFEEDSRRTQMKKAHFASRTIDVEVEFVNELQHPMVSLISGKLKTEFLSKFTFGDIMVREMDNLLRIKIDGFLEEMKSKRWSEYDGRIRRVFMITELYYGTIKMVVEKQFSASLDAVLKKSDTEALSRTAGSHAVEYEFSHANVPFAMRLERVRSFNG